MRTISINALKVWSVLFILVVFVSTAVSQGTNNEKTDSEDLNSQVSAFLSTYLEYYDSLSNERDIRVFTLNGEAGYFLSNTFALVGGAQLLLTEGERIIGTTQEKLGADEVGLALSGTIRFHIMNRRKTRVFIDGSPGILYTSDEFPPRGTNWNFIGRLGVGVSTKISNKTDIMVGLRYLHISNGKGEGHPKNPAYDGIGGLIGILYGM